MSTADLIIELRKRLREEKHTPLGYNACVMCRILWALSYPVGANITEVKEEHIIHVD